MTKPYPNVLVIENTLEDDDSTYAVSSYGAPYIRLDSVPRSRTQTELLLASLFLLIAVDVFQTKQSFLVGIFSPALAASLVTTGLAAFLVSAGLAFTHWRNIGRLVKLLRAQVA